MQESLHARGCDVSSKSLGGENENVQVVDFLLRLPKQSMCRRRQSRKPCLDQSFKCICECIGGQWMRALLGRLTDVFKFKLSGKSASEPILALGVIFGEIAPCKLPTWCGGYRFSCQEILNFLTTRCNRAGFACLPHIFKLGAFGAV